MKTCPLMKKPCIEHSCAWYTHVVGMHPQTGKDMDHWDCAVTWLPLMMTEQARMTRCVAGSVDSMRNEVVQRQDALYDAATLGVHREKAISVDPPPPLLDGVHES